MNKRQAIAAVRAEADAIIEQAERRARGWDKGMFRDDDAQRTQTIRQRVRQSVRVAFELARTFA